MAWPSSVNVTRVRNKQKKIPDLVLNSFDGLFLNKSVDLYGFPDRLDASCFSHWWERWELGVSSRMEKESKKKQNPKTYKCFLSAFVCCCTFFFFLTFVLFWRVFLLACEKWRKRDLKKKPKKQIKAEIKHVPSGSLAMTVELRSTTPLDFSSSRLQTSQ